MRGGLPSYPFPANGLKAGPPEEMDVRSTRSFGLDSSELASSKFPSGLLGHARIHFWQWTLDETIDTACQYSMASRFFQPEKAASAGFQVHEIVWQCIAQIVGLFEIPYFEISGRAQ